MSVASGLKVSGLPIGRCRGWNLLLPPDRDFASQSARHYASLSILYAAYFGLWGLRRMATIDDEVSEQVQTGNRPPRILAVAQNDRTRSYPLAVDVEKIRR